MFAKALTAVGTAAVLGLGFPLNAHAANGTFLFHTQPGNAPHLLNNPADNRCYTVGNAVGLTENNTNRTAELYDDRACRGDIVQMLQPGDGLQRQRRLHLGEVRALNNPCPTPRPVSPRPPARPGARPCR